MKKITKTIFITLELTEEEATAITVGMRAATMKGYEAQNTSEFTHEALEEVGKVIYAELEHTLGLK